MPEVIDNQSHLNYQWVRAPDGALAGVCKGLGQSLGIKVGVLRVVWLVALLWFGTGLLLYCILAFCLPRSDKLDQALRGKLLGVCARISKRYQVEVGLVRTGFVLLALVTFGIAIIGYGLAYFLIPDQQDTLKSPSGAGDN